MGHDKNTELELPRDPALEKAYQAALGRLKGRERLLGVTVPAIAKWHRKGWSTEEIAKSMRVVAGQRSAQATPEFVAFVISKL